MQIDGHGRTIRSFETPIMGVGIAIVGGRIYLLGSNHNDVPFTLLRIDVRGARHEIVELAEVPFVARALAFDGRRFWTHDKNENAIVSFAKTD